MFHLFHSTSVTIKFPDQNTSTPFRGKQAEALLCQLNQAQNEKIKQKNLPLTESESRRHQRVQCSLSSRENRRQSYVQKGVGLKTSWALSSILWLFSHICPRLLMTGSWMARGWWLQGGNKGGKMTEGCSDLLRWGELRACCEDHPLQQRRGAQQNRERERREAGKTGMYCCWFQQLGWSKNLGLESGSLLGVHPNRWRVMETMREQTEERNRARYRERLFFFFFLLQQADSSTISFFLFLDIQLFFPPFLSVQLLLWLNY